MSSIISLQKEALQLTERYFAGETSLEDERKLRQLLAMPELEGDSLDEARAVLGFAAVSPLAKPGKGSSSSWRVAMKVAASVALLFAIGVSFYAVSDSEYIGRDSVAYVDGERIDNPVLVAEIMHSELSLLGEATAEVREDISSELSEFSKVLNHSDNRKL